MIQDGPQTSLPEGVQAGEVAISAFISSMRVAIPPPLLASLPIEQATFTAQSPLPRRSERIASQPLNSDVRPSKRGEQLLLRRLGHAPKECPVSEEARRTFRVLFCSPVSSSLMVALRELFPAARHLTDDELSRAAARAACAGTV